MITQFAGNAPVHLCITHHAFCARNPFEIVAKRPPRAEAPGAGLVTKYQAARLLKAKVETIERGFKHGLLSGKLVGTTAFFTLDAVRAYLAIEPRERKRLIRRSVNNDGYAD